MGSNRPKVSVIVPVYNNEGYIGKALESLAKQTLSSSQLEVLVIDDGSNDDTVSICDEYARRFSNYIVIHQKNSGVSKSRNRGLELAKGEYIAFLDSDDTLDPSTLESAALFFDQHYAETDAVVYPMRLFNDVREWSHVREKILTESGIYDLSKIQHAFALVTNVNVMVKNTADLPRFQEDLLVHEDELFFMNVLLGKLTVGFSKKGCYRYRQEGGSAIYTKMHPYYQFEENIEFWEELFSRYPEKPPLYLQASYLNELLWKLKKDYVFPYHYRKTDFDTACKRIRALLKLVDDDLIVTAPRSDEYLQEFFLSLKHGRALSCKVSEQGFILSAHDVPILCRNHITAEVLRTYGKNSHWHVEGYLKSIAFGLIGEPEFTAEIEPVSGETISVPIRLTDSSRSRHLCHIQTNTFWGFSLDLPLERDARVTLRIKLGDTPVPITTHFTNRASLNSEAGILACFYGESVITAHPSTASFTICAEATRRQKTIVLEKNDASVLKKNKKGFVLRRLVRLLPSKRRIWLYYDRAGVGKDNSYYQFIHDLEKQDGVARFYVTNNDEQTNKRLFSLQQMKHVLAFSSNKHRLLHLKAEKILASYIEPENWRPFYQKALNAVADLVNYELVYLQHGVLHAHMPWKYSADRLLMDKEVVSTHFEIENLKTTYGFSDEKLIRSGMPRFDHIDTETSPKKKILFAPSWRKYLIDEVSPLVFKPKRRAFEESTFWIETNKLLTSRPLLEALEHYDYSLDIKLHPIFKEYAPYFVSPSKRIKLVNDVAGSDYQIFVTDYSSWVFDFVYLKRAIAYFLPDKAEFDAGLNGYRKLDLPFEQGFGPLATKGEDLVNNLVSIMENKGAPETLYARRMEGFFLHYDNKQCDRLYEELNDSFLKL
ncbi:bifunctional glycosyltransferase/CDP-glycerol:glycerophosphate glycerophosphotransferase [Raoultibacter phocaeensis]|uniref:bifunctional glycosyltransferase/CDP-glycerol:glycerophosphate glycerophosphotransferase n=1 Tax=Raoultibacter phocaeensis TaxID=2479841 RepID=UPI00111A8E4E|nr:glycosyltransferase [Raoultibacter phocaeensis]